MHDRGITSDPHAMVGSICTRTMLFVVVLLGIHSSSLSPSLLHRSSTEVQMHALAWRWRHYLHVCVCVCRLLQLLKDQSSASKSFYIGFYIFMLSWISIRGFAK